MQYYLLCNCFLCNLSQYNIIVDIIKIILHPVVTELNMKLYMTVVSYTVHIM